MNTLGIMIFCTVLAALSLIGVPFLTKTAFVISGIVLIASISSLSDESTRNDSDSGLVLFILFTWSFLTLIASAIVWIVR